MKNTAKSMPGERRKLLGPVDLHALERLRREYHADCLACTNPLYRLEFARGRADVLIARFQPREELCSYRGVMHGGVVSLLIDEAMTCCLMAHGVLGLTGELKLRFHESVGLGDPVEIRTRVTTTFSPLYHLESDLLQGGSMKVSGMGRFLRRAEDER